MDFTDGFGLAETPRLNTTPRRTPQFRMTGLPEPLQQYEAKATHFAKRTARWFAENLKIVDRDNNLVPFMVNSQQKHTLFWVGMQLAAGVPVRVIILKARRMGMSTLITALGFMFTILRSNYPAFACAHDAAGTDTLRTMARTFQEELPPHLKREAKYDNQQNITFDPPHRSSYRFHTAGAKGKSGRSKEITYLHISEKAHVDHFAQVAAGIMACVPRKNPLSCIFEESTANGEMDDGQFHESWNAAVKHRERNPDDLRGYITLFFPWLDFPEYRETPPKNYEWGEFDEWEYRLKDLGADEEQLFFRRVVMAEDYAGDPEIFAQEYPATPEEAFRTSGRPAIEHAIIAYHESLCCPPARKVVLRRNGEGKVVAFDAPERCPCYWEVWFEPQKGCDYTVFGDVAEGELSDPQDEKSKSDDSAGAVLNRMKLQYDAICVNKLGADEWGYQLRMCAEWYNDAWASPEVNGLGQAALAAFKDYYRIPARKGGEPVSLEDRVLKALGFETTRANREFMIDTWRSHSLPHPTDKFHDKLQVFSAKAVAQEKTFIWKKTGNKLRREHANGAKDDIMFAMFGALQLHIDCPRTYEPLEYQNRPAVHLDSRFAGGYDDDLDDEEEVTYQNASTT